jgi:hypothetical protein
MKALSLIPTLAIILLANCDSKDDVAPEDFSCRGRIAAGDAEAVKSCVQTSWKVHYFKSESGKIHMGNSYFDFKSNDSLYYIFEGDILAESVSTLFTDASGIWIQFSTIGKLRAQLRVKDLASDTLYLSIGSDKTYYAMTASPYIANYNCGGPLDHKALNQIRSCIQGKWQYLSSYGGYAGTFDQCSNCFITFSANDSVRYVQDGIEKVKARIEWQKYESPTGKTSHRISLGNAYTFPDGLFILQGIGDKLYLTDGADDGYIFELKRSY